MASEKSYFDVLTAKLGDFNNYNAIGGFRSKENIDKNNFLKTFLKNNPHITLPPIVNHCACGHWIKVNCYIHNIITDEIKVVGNCCIKLFGITHKCTNCNEPFKRYSNSVCKKCEYDIKKKIADQKKVDRENKKKIADFENAKNKAGKEKIKFGKWKGYSIAAVSKEDLSYIKWCFDKYNSEYITSFENIANYYKNYI